MNRERLPWRLVYRVALVAAAIITLSAVPGVGAHAGDPEGPISGVRVPAEWELQEAIWLQWPGRFEKVYEPAFAECRSSEYSGHSDSVSKRRFMDSI